MPRIKRYFPVSHDINEDPEIWEMTAKFGDRSIRIWLEILCLLDKKENHLKMSDELLASISRKVRQTLATVQRVVGYALAKGWLESDQQVANYSSGVVSAPNYMIYHRTKEHKKNNSVSMSGSESVPSFPSPPFPSQKKDKKEKKDPPTPPQAGGIPTSQLASPAETPTPTNGTTPRRKSKAKPKVKPAVLTWKPERFEKLWNLYPNGIGYQDAIEVWEALKPSDKILEKMKVALAWQMQSNTWIKEQGEFVPKLATYLERQRWMDKQSVELRKPRKVVT